MTLLFFYYISPQKFKKNNTMKKFLFGGFVLAALTVSSCAKEYNCECIVTHTEVNTTMGLNLNASKSDTTSYSLKGKEDDMKQSCTDSGYKMSYKDQLNTDHTIISVCRIK